MNLEWYDWAVMYFLFIPSVIGAYYWQRPDVIAYAEREFAKVGDTARALDVRLSMHPGQFTVLASDNADIVDRSIEEFEYHTDVIRYMGYGKSFQDFKCNVHISGRNGPAGIIAALQRLTARSAKRYHNRKRRKQVGHRTQPRTCRRLAHLSSTYTITGAEKENTYSPPTIDISA